MLQATRNCDESGSDDSSDFSYVYIPADDARDAKELRACWPVVTGVDSLPGNLAAAFGETDETGCSGNSVETFVLLRPADLGATPMCFKNSGGGVLFMSRTPSAEWLEIIFNLSISFLLTWR